MASVALCTDKGASRLRHKHNKDCKAFEAFSVKLQISKREAKDIWMCH